MIFMANYIDKGYSNEMDRSDKQYVDISPNQIAESVAFIDKDILGKLRGSIFRGASKVEMTFFGGPGYKSDKATPETMTPDIREDLRNMALINDVKTTTHASVNISGVSGIHEGQFSEEARNLAVNEIKQTINFAAEATTGGAVVFHSGEFRRPIYSTPDDVFSFDDASDDTKIFSLYNKQENKIVSFPANKPVPIEYIDSDGNIKLEKKSFEQFKKDQGKINLSKDEELEVFKDFYVNNVNQGKIRELQGRLDREQAEFQTAMLNLQEVENNIESVQGKEKEHLLAKKRTYELMRDSFKASEAGIKSQLQEIKTTLNDFDTVENSVLNKTAKSMAELGMYAMQRSDDMFKEAKKMKMEDKFTPIFIAPENVFPDSYGAHPQELREIIQSGRNEMIDRLKKKGYDEKEADKLSKTHIKATFDTGHVNLWWKYFSKNSNMSETDKRKEFGRWVVSEFQKLAKDDLLGHIHLTDNLGFADEHIVIGQGKAPIKEVLDVIKSEAPHLLNEIVIEPGGDNLQTILHDTWRELNSPVYPFEHYGKGQATFKEVSTSYLERSQVPYFSASLDVEQGKKGYLFKTSYSGLDFR